MTTGTRVGRRKFLSRQDKATPYPLPCWDVLDEDVQHQERKCSKAPVEKKDWEDATCSVCLEFPHNAVLLLCSSHNNGCRPYMCATSYRYSNCLDQFEKAYSKIMSQQEDNIRSAGTEKSELRELAACPFCRGQVKGWTVVEPAREYLNAKKRSCMQDNCTFVGTYKELRKHVRREHLSARPREVDPILEQKWKRLESEREREDVISTLRSSLPGALVLGDYVIERGNHHSFDITDEDDDEEGGPDVDYGGFEMGIDDNNHVFFLLQGAGNHSLNTQLRRLGRGSYQGGSVLNGEGVGRGSGGGGIGVPPPMAADASGEVVAPVASASQGEEDDDESRVVDHQQGRVVGIGRSERRRRRRRQRRSTMAVT